ncbi:MAG: hypothetical protein JWO91_3880 [Acidobacteriaceae bacterium]|nr:hypothetical protein [Acidobacteriaceae bacterium]
MQSSHAENQAQANKARSTDASIGCLGIRASGALPEFGIDQCGAWKCETAQLRDPIERSGHNCNPRSGVQPTGTKAKKAKKWLKDQRLRVVKFSVWRPAWNVDVCLIAIEDIGKGRVVHQLYRRANTTSVNTFFHSRARYSLVVSARLMRLKRQHSCYGDRQPPGFVTIRSFNRAISG